MPLSQEQLGGLHWKKTVYGPEPEWTVDPELKSIKSTLRPLWPSKRIKASRFSQGAFNKLYEISVEGQPPLLLRITLPVDPRYKTLSEVATIRWVSQLGIIPVPRIIHYNCFRDSPVGFEWILMTKLEGTRLCDNWSNIDFTRKQDLVKQFASFSANLYNQKFRGIGNIYPGSLSTALPGLPPTGRIVSMPFFWNNNIHQDINRGPFRSSQEWLSTRLSLYESDCTSVLEKYKDNAELDKDAEAELDNATRTLNIVEKLQPLLDQIFPNQSPIEERTVLWHGDLHLANILTDKRGKLTGVVDWECVSALPIWKACSYPRFLESKTRNKKPDITRYSHLELYQDHLMEYEMTQLRVVFLEEMGKLNPRWVSMFNACQVERDFDLAVKYCDCESSSRQILEWADNIASGRDNERSLREMFYKH
ncbi:Altered inheritance of mitochondria protein 9, mitochondrial [Fusarium austroafricanum]|uniref:Altered inheritance of mitochondria protein 9, mitochondrial n=1 Tax=Fusarium austroafricanum TaxID=2364996 RepID=A0A8H4KP72_9HYPO|nr:Altered inheritance of mitochondria protein 9, mitochondrial [Fusarium austroafricanum]